MADTYAVAAGIVLFEPETRHVNGQDLREVKIRTVATQKVVRVTLWPEWADVPISKGDFLLADGPYRVTSRPADDGSAREFVDLTARSLAVVPAAAQRRAADALPEPPTVSVF